MIFVKRSAESSAVWNSAKITADVADSFAAVAPDIFIGRNG
jgi:hypothetical protein